MVDLHEFKLCLASAQRKNVLCTEDVVRMAPALVEEIEALREAQNRHLKEIVRLSQTMPFADEVNELKNQRGTLLAEIGTLKNALCVVREDSDKALNEERERYLTLAKRTTLAVQAPEVDEEISEPKHADPEETRKLLAYVNSVQVDESKWIDWADALAATPSLPMRVQRMLTRWTPEED